MAHDNPPAFPIPNDDRPGAYEAAPGMSLRDWLAGQALASIGTWTPEHGGINLSSYRAMQARALWAYEQADAMLAPRAEASNG